MGNEGGEGGWWEHSTHTLNFQKIIEWGGINMITLSARVVL